MRLQFGFVNISQENFGTKAAPKMLLKLTTGSKCPPRERRLKDVFNQGVWSLCQSS